MSCSSVNIVKGILMVSIVLTASIADASGHSDTGGVLLKESIDHTLKQERSAAAPRSNIESNDSKVGFQRGPADADSSISDSSAPMKSLPIGIWKGVIQVKLQNGSVVERLDTWKGIDGKYYFERNTAKEDDGEAPDGFLVPSSFNFNPNGTCTLGDGNGSASICKGNSIQIQSRDDFGANFYITEDSSYTWSGELLSVKFIRQIHREGTTSVESYEGSLKKQ